MTSESLDLDRLSSLALEAGESILADGAETYRVEELIGSLFRAFSLRDYDSFVIPTGIILFMEAPDGTHLTRIRRISTRGTNLQRLVDVVTWSRVVRSGEYTLDQAENELRRIRLRPSQTSFRLTLAAGFMCAFFSLLFGGSWGDFGVSFLVGCATRIVSHHFAKVHVTQFFTNIIGGALAATVALLCASMFDLFHDEKIIISSILLMAPGLAFTSAIRDTIAGDLVAGVARALEAIINAFGIAFGTGMGMLLWTQLLQSHVGG